MKRMTINHKQWLLILVFLCMTVAGCTARASSGYETDGQAAAWGVGSEEQHFWGMIPEQLTYAGKERTKTSGSAEEQGLAEESDEPIIVPVLAEEELRAAMDAYGIEDGSGAALALEEINGTYAVRLSEKRRSQPLVFFFEGAGDVSDPKQRRNALCVVVRDGKIVYLNQESSTIPDYPFVAWKNDGRDVPTLKSGVYDFSTVNHNGWYGALLVLDDKVVRFRTPTDFYNDVSYRQSIEIHRRVTDEISPDDEAWGNSVGCLLVGDASTDPKGTYAGFIQAVGIVPGGARGDSRYQLKVSGTVIVDRSFGADYLRAVGYSNEGIAALES